MLITILIFILILAVLVFVHEFGHFIVAKKSGMKVDEFGFGFPPRLAGIQKVQGKWKIVWGMKAPLDPDQTVFSINAIPLGGFVKIVGENNEQENDPRSFVNRPFWARLLTLIAGVLMNIILAWVLISAGYMFGGLPAAVNTSQGLSHGGQLHNPQVIIVGVLPGQPAEKAGLQAGDVILQLDHQANISALDIDAVQQYIKSHEGKIIDFTVQRVNQKLDVNVQSLANPGPDQGPTGIELALLGRLSFPWYWAPLEGAHTVYGQVKSIVGGLYQLFTTKAGIAAVGGPVKIAKLTGQVADLGFVYLIQFAAFLSLNLAVLNILPFPALDGGRVLFLVIEKIRGKRNNPQIEQWVNTVGFVLLLLLMVVVTVKDIVKK
jgi:regulator of sigma E protease